MTRATTRFLSVLLLVATPAMAITDGWDESIEFPTRAWTSDSLTWARQVHPDHPTTTFIAANVSPPPREMWCSYGWNENCDAWEARMDLWLHHYLDVPYTDPLPAVPPWPKECVSSCSQF